MNFCAYLFDIKSIPKCSKLLLYYSFYTPMPSELCIFWHVRLIYIYLSSIRTLKCCVSSHIFQSGILIDKLIHPHVQYCEYYLNESSPAAPVTEKKQENFLLRNHLFLHEWCILCPQVTVKILDCKIRRPMTSNMLWPLATPNLYTPFPKINDKK